MNELISIIIPIYKVERHLRFCLDSVVSQTYKNLQIILINDGSPDHCEEICLEYCKKDSRFDYHYKRNGGIGDTRNYAMKHYVQGDFVMFLDSDDAIHPQQIEILYNLLVSNKECSFSSGQFIRFQECSDINIQMVSDYTGVVQPAHHAIYSMLNPQTYKDIAREVVWNKLYRTLDISDCIFHNQSPSEDIYFNSQLYTKINKFVETDTILYYYRKNPNSITSSIDYKYTLILAKRMADLYEFLGKTSYTKLQNLAIRCIVKKYLATRLLEKNNKIPELVKQRKDLELKYIPLYFNTPDSLKMKLVLGIFYNFPFTFRWFRSFMEWKANK